MEADFTVAGGSTVEVRLMEAGGTTPTVAPVSTAAIMRADIMAGAVDTTAGTALIGAIRITATDGDLVSGLGLLGPIHWATHIRTDMVPGGEHPPITATITPTMLLLRTLTTEAMILAHQILVRNPTAIQSTTIQEFPPGAPEAATP